MQTTGQEVMESIYFLSEEELQDLASQNSVDFFVIGSSFCALAFVKQILNSDPHLRIIVIERGSLFLPDHFHNLPWPYQRVCRAAGSCPWTISERTSEGQFIKSVYGLMPFFGGRSTYWSAWSPQPTESELVGWPRKTVEAIARNFKFAKKLLNIVSVDGKDFVNDRLASGDAIYGVLQQELTAILKNRTQSMPAIYRVEAAQIAIDPDYQAIDRKYSTPGKLLELHREQEVLAKSGNGGQLRILTDCTVEEIVQTNGRAAALRTTRGVLPVGNAEIILAMGALPATTLIANSFPAHSFPSLRNVGERFTAHFMSLIIARIPRSAFHFSNTLPEWEMAAIYVAGKELGSQGQFHTQLLVLSDKDPSTNHKSTARYGPELIDKASQQQLMSCKDHLLFVCTVLGEIDYKNEDNWFRRNNDRDWTSNSTLQVVANDTDLAVWDAMDCATFELLEKVILSAAKKPSCKVEYWHGPPDVGGWKSDRTPAQQIRKPGLVHEGSTLWLAEDSDPEAPVDTSYKLRGVENVYVTGSGLWPSGGSWNPTPTMVALAQDLADHLQSKRLAPLPLPNEL